MFFPIWFRVDARSCWQLLWNRLLKPQTCRTKVSWCLLGNYRWLGKNMLGDYWRLVTVPSLFASMLRWPSSRLLHIVYTEDSDFFVRFPKFHLSKYVGCSTEETPPPPFFKGKCFWFASHFFPSITTATASVCWQADDFHANYSTLWATNGLTRRFLVQRPLCNWFHLPTATSSNH